MLQIKAKLELASKKMNKVGERMRGGGRGGGSWCVCVCVCVIVHNISGMYEVHGIR